MKNIDINDLIAKVNIVDVISNFSKLIKTGSSLKTLCNVHGDKTPSLSINPKKQIYKCFVCDHGGNVLDYLIWAQKFSWNEAIEYLVKSSGDNIEDYKMILNKKKTSETELKLIKALQDSSDIFNYFINIYLDEGDNELFKFVSKRKINKDIINKFKLGYAPNISLENDYISILEKKGNEKSTLINASILNELGTHSFFKNRLIFPIFDFDNNVIAFSGRIINEDKNSPKYLNSRESLIFKKSSVIYNYNNAKKFDQIIIVEGFMDVIAFYRIGIENSIALMGLSLSKNTLNILKNHKEILIFLDNDEAGKKATMKLIHSFIINNINAFILNNQESKDPDEILNETNGEEKLKNILLQKINMNKFIFDYFTSDIDKNNYVQIKNSIIEIYKYTKDFDDFIKLDLISRLSKEFNIDNKIISNYFNNSPSMIELKELNNKNINTKNTLEFELNQPININKLLISIWQNPSFLNIQNLDQIKWPRAEYKKIYEEIKKYHLKNQELSQNSYDFIQNKSKLFSSKESLPKNIESFEELIIRTKKDSYDSKIAYIDDLFNNSNDEHHKEELLKIKFNIKSKKE